MVAKIRRDVADSQAALGSPIIRVVSNRRQQSRGETLVPAPAFLEYRAPLRRLETECIREVARGHRIAWIELDGAAEAVDGGVEIARGLEHAAEVIEEGRVARVQLQASAEHRLRLLEAAERAQQATQVVQCHDRVRARPDRRLI